MTISRKTAVEVLALARERFGDDRKLSVFLRDLTAVPGNESFVFSVKLLQRALDAARKPEHPRDAHDRAAAAEAEKFVATAFRGRGQYDRRECKTYDEAMTAARDMRTDRPVAIYAVSGKRCTFVESV